MEQIKCIKCEKEVITDIGQLHKDNINIGLHIENFAFKQFPRDVYICSSCTDDIAVKFMTGDLSIMKVLSALRR